MPVNVIIIEDEKSFLDCLKILLGSSKDIKVTETFHYGEAALNYIADTSPDVAVVDLHLPDITGVELIKKIKLLPNEIDILVLTKFDDDEHIFPALEAGAVGYLLKDDPPAEFINAIIDVNKGRAPMSSRIARRVLESFHTTNRPKGQDKNGLTPRETEVLEMLSKGFTPREVGKKLFISYESVRSHLKNIYKKLHAHSLNDAIYKAKDKELI